MVVLLNSVDLMVCCLENVIVFVVVFVLIGMIVLGMLAVYFGLRLFIWVEETAEQIVDGDLFRCVPFVLFGMEIGWFLHVLNGMLI